MPKASGYAGKTYATRSSRGAKCGKTEAYKLKFAIASVYDVRPSPSNLAIWKLTDDPACEHCGRRATLEHILSSCPKSLSGGKYRWRHDQVLEAMAGGLDTAVNDAEGKQRRTEGTVPLIDRRSMSIEMRRKALCSIDSIRFSYSHMVRSNLFLCNMRRGEHRKMSENVFLTLNCEHSLNHITQ